MATTHPHAPPLRAACLRGIAAQADGPHAVVALSAEQYLLLPLPEPDLARWRAQVGRRVWVDLNTRPMRLQADAGVGAVHA